MSVPFTANTARETITSRTRLVKVEIVIPEEFIDINIRTYEVEVPEFVNTGFLAAIQSYFLDDAAELLNVSADDLDVRTTYV